MRRTLIELLHIAAGIDATAVFAAAAGRALPPAAATAWGVAYGGLAGRADRDDRPADG